jgi:D-threo-aldose 1-dehydrogenase
MESPVATSTIGRTGVPVTRMGFGSVFIGQPGVPERQAIETVQHALARGITLFDTAPQYGSGLSERLFSAALSGVDRNSYVLATKVGKLVTPEGTIVMDYSREGTLRSIDESLSRLKADRIDVVHIHDPDDHEREALEEVFSVLAELRAQGVIRAIGAGMNQWEMLARFARQADFDCFLLAGRYTLLEQKALDTFLPLCLERNIGVILGGVFNSGILATGARPGASYQYGAASPQILERVGRIEAVCSRYNVPLPTAALQFPLAHPAVTSMVIGAKSPQEIDANLAAFEQAIPAALWVELRAEGLIAADAPVPQGAG